uniref:Uncharacterized protein n=1 Tax=Alexandrium monilatum TaxID=311494 RepID=A0A7S4VFI2_9DINO
MASVAPIELSREAAEQVSGLGAALKAAAGTRNPTPKVLGTIWNRNFELLWTDQVEGAPKILAKVAPSKARFMWDGKPLVNSNICVVGVATSAHGCAAAQSRWPCKDRCRFRCQVIRTSVSW